VTLRDYVAGVRRRWYVVVAFVIVGLASSFITNAAAPPPVTAGAPGLYSATVILLGPPGPTSGVGSLSTLAALTKIGEIPVRVAEELDRGDDPKDLAAHIAVIADPSTGLMTISALTAELKEAKLLANAFADELVEYQSSTDNAFAEQSPLAGSLEIIDRGAPHEGRPVETIDTGGAQAGEAAQAVVYFAEAEAADEDRPEDVPLAESGWTVPGGHPVRLVISGGSGFILGLALVLLLERFDPKLRSRHTTEAHFSYPMVTEIPAMSRKELQAPGPVLGAPQSASADAFRLLRAGLRSNLPQRANGNGRLHDAGPKVILVTSPGRNEGKTTVATNLAAAYSEVGERAIILSCDLRDPEIDHQLGVEPSDRLADELRPPAGEPMTLRRFAVAGDKPERPAQILASKGMRQAIADARRDADVVVIDTPSLLVTSDPTLLFPEVDAVLVVAHASKTSIDRADVADEMLRRLDAPVAGIVLNGVNKKSHHYGYYYAYRDPKSDGTKGFPRLARHHTDA
jgi:Mrp family chromosome partitioning ATPase